MPKVVYVADTPWSCPRLLTARQKNDLHVTHENKPTPARIRLCSAQRPRCGSGKKAPADDWKPISYVVPGQQYPPINSERRAKIRINAPNAKEVGSDIGGEKRESELKDAKTEREVISFVEVLNFQGNDLPHFAQRIFR